MQLYSLPKVLLLAEESHKLVDARHALGAVPRVDQLHELQHHTQLAGLLDLLDLVQEVHLLLAHELLNLLDLLPDPVIHGGTELEVAQLVQDLLLLDLDVYGVEDCVQHHLAVGDTLHQLVGEVDHIARPAPARGPHLHHDK